MEQRNYEYMPSKDKYFFYFPKHYETKKETRIMIDGYVGALPVTSVFYDKFLNQTQQIITLEVKFMKHVQSFTYMKFGDVFSRLGGITSLITSGMSIVSYIFMLYFIYALALIIKRKAKHEARNIEIRHF